MKEGPNYHEISEEKKELNRVIGELVSEGEDIKGGAKHYKSKLEKIKKKSQDFKIAELGGFGSAKVELYKQKKEYDSRNDSLNNIDYDAIYAESPEIKDVLSAVENLSGNREFVMKRMMELLDPNISLAKRNINLDVLETVKIEILEQQKALEEADPIVLRKAELIKHKEELSKAGHICITPSVEKDLEAIGDRMLTGKPMFLHGPTGTGKTSLARYAAVNFTGKDSEMVFCNPQTRESNVWGKTGIRPSGIGGAIETVEIYGPLAKAMTEGKTVIFDEFTALPKEHMVSIKGILNAKIGDKINIVGNGIVEIKPGFQMIFTANLKSKKNTERQDLPPEVAREFEQNNLEVKYIPQHEAYDVMISRLLNNDGSLEMSFYDLNTTLPNLCKAMSDIQESYTNETNKELAKAIGAMSSNGTTSSLEKFVMTQGSVEAILSSWLVEKQIKSKDRTFSEFLDERLKTALTFKEYSKEDRMLAAKILVSKGFLLTLTTQDLDLPEDVFKLSATRSIHGKESIVQLKKDSGDEDHLALQDVALLDPFKKRAETLKNRAKKFLNKEGDGVKDPFLNTIDGRLAQLFGKGGETTIESQYKNLDGKIEKISINLEQKLKDFLSFYTEHNIDLPAGFEQKIISIWKNNSNEIKKEIETYGFNDIIIAGNTPLNELKDKMIIGKGYATSGSFETSGGFAGVVSGVDVAKPRIILVHNVQNIEDQQLLKISLNTDHSKVPLETMLSLEDYLVLQKKYFVETGKHLDDNGFTWLSSKAGSNARISSGYRKEIDRVDLTARDPQFGRPNLGTRVVKKFY